MRIEQGMFLLFLLITAMQDLKRKSVRLWVYILFALGAAGALIYLWASGQEVIWTDRILGAGLGLIMLGGSIAGRGSVGLGDGAFFLISGLMLGFWDNLALLLYGSLCCGLYCLVLLAVNLLLCHRNIRKRTVPFLPFLIPVAIWIVWR